MSKNLVFERYGVEYMKLALGITAYWVGSVFDHAEGVLHFYRQALRLVGGEMRHYATGEMLGFQPIREGVFETVPRWLRRRVPAEDTEYIMTLEGSTDPQVSSDVALAFWAIEYRDRAVGAMHLVLPTSFIETSSDRLRRLTEHLLSRLRIHSGHCGYTINWNPIGRYATQSRRALGAVASRYPAIDLPHMVGALTAIPAGIKRVNWLTCLGATLVDGLGGPQALMAGRAAPGVAMQPLGLGGLMLVAGDRPRSGDVNRRDDLNDYHTVGRLLASVRSHRHPPFLARPNGEEGDELTAEWLAYFDH